MQKDIHGFVFNLDQNVPDLINESIYRKDRAQKHSQANPIGGMVFLRNVYLLNDKAGIEKANNYDNAQLVAQGEYGQTLDPFLCN
jgi:hypothetical protein